MPSVIDLRKPHELGRTAFRETIRPLFLQVAQDLDADGCVKLWSGFLAAAACAMVGNIGAASTDSVLDEVRRMIAEEMAARVKA